VVSTDCTARRCSTGHALAGIAIATMMSSRQRPTTDSRTDIMTLVRHALVELCTVPVLLVLLFFIIFLLSFHMVVKLAIHWLSNAHQNVKVALRSKSWLRPWPCNIGLYLETKILAWASSVKPCLTSRWCMLNIRYRIILSQHQRELKALTPARENHPLPSFFLHPASDSQGRVAALPSHQLSDSLQK